MPRKELEDATRSLLFFECYFFITKIAVGFYRLIGVFAEDFEAFDERHAVFVEEPDRAMIFVDQLTVQGFDGV